MAIRCGHCKATHATVTGVRLCAEETRVRFAANRVAPEPDEHAWERDAERIGALGPNGDDSIGWWSASTVGSDEWNRQWAQMKNEAARVEAAQERAVYLAEMERECW